VFHDYTAGKSACFVSYLTCYFRKGEDNTIAVLQEKQAFPGCINALDSFSIYQIYYVLRSEL
jgi:hypothetical protein